MLKYGAGSRQPTIVSHLHSALNQTSELLRRLRQTVLGICLSTLHYKCPVHSLAIRRVDKRFIKPSTIERWVVVVYERQQRFGPQQAQEMIRGLIASCEQVGASVE